MTMFLKLHSHMCRERLKERKRAELSLVFEKKVRGSSSSVKKKETVLHKFFHTLVCLFFLCKDIHLLFLKLSLQFKQYESLFSKLVLKLKSHFKQWTKKQLKTFEFARMNILYPLNIVHKKNVLLPEMKH